MKFLMNKKTENTEKIKHLNTETEKNMCLHILFMLKVKPLHEKQCRSEAKRNFKLPLIAWFYRPITYLTSQQ